jgi:DNA polymerase delta subunit 2
MLVSYLQGQFTTDAAKVCRVLLAGAGPSSQDPLQGIKELDAFGVQLTRAGIPLDIMPAKDDPTTANWPQRPLHSSLLPHATNIVFRATNPYAAGHGAKLVVATDGANVHDLQTHIVTDDQQPLTELQALQQTLEWGHMCPTGPASVGTVPHIDSDPMVLDQSPHLYLCGNAQEGFATKTTANGTTLICVPKFSETGEAVLVNLETCAVQLLRFDDTDS